VSGDTSTTIVVMALEGYKGKKFEDFYAPVFIPSIDFKNACRAIVFAGSSGYDCPAGSHLGKDAIFFYHGALPFVIYDNIVSYLSRQIISTFTFLPTSTGL
jgi:hypothetical protein